MIRVTALLATLGLAGCHTTSMQPAEVMDNSPETRAALSSQLGSAVGRARIDISPVDLSGASTVSVLPPPLGQMETASTAMPTSFDIMTSDGACYAVHSKTGEVVALEGVACEPAGT
ncbi:MAG: hypothetical protein AAF216_06705 [Pseudomonadota bacterium]